VPDRREKRGNLDRQTQKEGGKESLDRAETAQLGRKGLGYMKIRVCAYLSKKIQTVRIPTPNSFIILRGFFEGKILPW